MQIFSISDIVEGELVNSPAISFVYNIKTNPKKVNEGDLFIAKNPRDLQLAVNNGAFAVIYDFETTILDFEIAWIKVDSYQGALKRLFRYKLSTVNLDVFYCDEITCLLLNTFKNSNKSIKLISSSLESSIKLLENLNEKDYIFSSDKQLLHDIYPDYKLFNKIEPYEVSNFLEHSLFEVTFTYNDSLFHKIKLPSLYVNQFLDIYNFIGKEDCDLQKLKSFYNLKPIFINNFMELVEFGKSEKFIIPQKSISLVQKELSFLRKKFKYAKILVFANKDIKEFNDENIIKVNSLKKIKTLLSKHKFNCAYLIGFDYLKVEKILSIQESNDLLL